MLAAPLLLGCDLSLLDGAILGLLGNRELLAVHQDPLGRQASPWRSDDGLEIWRRPLADGSTAIGVFNRGERAASAAIDWAELGLRPRAVRDLSALRSLDVADGWQAVVGSHGSVVLRVW
jgi:alpha-galactosidase